jgi:heparin/heparan-sulfate lyase
VKNIYPIWGCWLILVSISDGFAAAAPTVFQAEDAKANLVRAEIVEQDTFQGKKGVALKSGQKPVTETEGSTPDVVFSVRAPQAGRYHLVTHTATDAVGKSLMKAATSKFASLSALIQIDQRRPTSRIIFVPWSPSESCSQNLGVFDLNGATQAVKFWLPAGVKLDRLEIHTYRSPAVPAEAASYRPKFLPPTSHPRLWVNADSLLRIRTNLNHPENRTQWERIKTTAAKPFVFKFDPKKEVAYNTLLENAAAAKAFVYLMQSDTKLGREAVQLMVDYLPRVEFGNLLDITREVGAAIYAAARVYDWCYNLCTPTERETLRVHMMRLAGEMECGWPPYKGGIVNGHGNEAMINRDLLSMGIALYNEDPLPYQYCAYLVLEQLVPMRRFEYQSPRHNQGVSYASFRFGWEMHAAWLLRRMTGQEVFDSNIKTVPNYWLYMRLPNGELLRDGDGVPSGKYWSYQQAALLCYSYSGDPILKGEFQRQGEKFSDPVLYLLLNDPGLKAELNLASLPLTLNFGPVLSGMIARTGWNVGTNSDDVVAEIKGGGFHFGNHQHADAGAIQIYYRGLQVADLGQYKFYGTPFDLNFNKRSIAHSMMLVVDPHEKFLSTPANDGGSRFLQSHPRTPEQIKKEPVWHYGKALSCSFGPSTSHPAFSYFSTDLHSAYSEKIAGYVRTFCFLNLNNASNPAAIIVLDDIRTAKPEFKKYWQINTLNLPQITPNGVQLHNTANGMTGRLDVCMLWPKPDERVLEIKSGAETHNVFGQTFTPPAPSSPEALGHRVLFSPKQTQAQDRFLTLLQACDAKTSPLPYNSSVTEASVIVQVADRIVSLAKGPNLISTPFNLTVPGDGKEYQVLLAGLQAGAWKVTASGGTPILNTPAEAGKNTLFFLSKGGSYHVTPLPKP